MVDGQRLAVASWGVGHMAVFRRTDNSVHVKQYSGGAWSGWVNLGGDVKDSSLNPTSPKSSPVAVSPGPGTLVACINGGSGVGTLRCRVFQNGSWGGWESLGATRHYQIVSSLPGTATVISVNPIASNIFSKTWNGTSWASAWSSVAQPGVGPSGTVAILDATSWGGGRIDVLWREYSTYQRPFPYPIGPNLTYERGHQLKHSWYDGLNWHHETMVPTVLGARIVTWGPDRLDVFYDAVSCNPTGCTSLGVGHLYAVGP